MRIVMSFFMMLLMLWIVGETQGQGKKGGFGGGGQVPFGGGGGPGSGKIMGNTVDPLMLFEKYANGRPYFLISENRYFQGPLTAYAKEVGITDEKITRQQFLTFYPKLDQYRAASGGGPGGRGQGNGPPGMMMMPGGGPPVQGGSAGNPVDQINQYAEFEFRRRDRNGDGFLNTDEMPKQLRDQLERWDTNKDGLISLDEFKAYYLASLNKDEGPQNSVIILIEEDYDRRPTVYRAGKLPSNLPKWFAELDSDKDGQVAMYEWRAGGKDLGEFKEWDRNDDGFITAEEVLGRMSTMKGGANGSGSLADGSGPNNPFAPQMGPGGNPFGKKGPRGGMGMDTGTTAGWNRGDPTAGGDGAPTGPTMSKKMQRDPNADPTGNTGKKNKKGGGGGFGGGN